MELFAAQDCPPLDVCLDALENSDVYVGLIGKLYGSSPPGRRLSYTELEYNRALELDMEKLVVVMRDDANVPANFVEQDPDQLTRLSRFRNRVTKQNTVQFFDSPHEAAWMILAALRMYETRIAEEAGGHL